MAPPKLKLHKNTGKLKSIPRPNSIPPSPAASGSAPASAAAPSEADRQFELELYWCIQQLETTLSLPSVRENNKKIEETSKLINTLKSGTQPVIRKRQIMRTTFGDYRSKMAAEEQTMAVNPDSVRFEEPKQKPKYHFVKKSAVLSGDTNFKFNFPTGDATEPEASPSEEGSEPVEPTEPERKKVATVAAATVNASRIVPSDNSFRFNFAVGSD
uniref:Uncharacterized protein n=1 Tax=Anopheles dirus TaxID=7168 RepID=A0A182MY55_9DIPT